jgi:D-alanyl-D-alanine carboxypeptidase
MKKSNLFLALAVIWLAAAAPNCAFAKIHHTPHHVHHGAGVDSGAGYSDIVIDAESGRVIHEVDSDDLRHPASLTKMMTLYITFEALEAGYLSLNQQLPVSENASYQSPSKLGLHAGRSIRVEDAILGVVTESANDAAVVLGEALGGSEEGFAQLMTKQARALGMTRTVFRNPSGLPNPDQVTTAHDMAVLGAALLRHYPEFYPYFSHDSFTYAGIYHHNHNHLMDRYGGMDGIKTGYIRASGFNLVASAKHGSTRLIGVVFGGKSAVSRDNHMAELLDQCFPVAEAERRSGHIAEATGEGDGGDNGDNDYVALPAKISAIFPSRNAIPAPTSIREPSPLQAPPQAQLQAPQVDTPIYAQSPASAPKPPMPNEATPSAPTPTAMVALSSPPRGNWGVQIGAYSDPAIGQQALESLTASMADLLSNGDPQVQKVSLGGVTMYRARVMALDKKTAQSVCSYLLQRGKSCLTVEP